MKVLKFSASLILTILIILLSALIPIYFSVTLLSHYKTALNVFKKVDYTEYIEQNQSIKKAVADSGDTPQQVNEKLKSDSMTETIEKYAPDINGVALDISKSENFDIDKLHDVIDENIEGISDIAEAYTGNEINSENLNSRIDELIDSNEETVEETLTRVIPNIKKAQPVLEIYEYSNTVSNHFPIKIGIAAIIFTLILAALLYILNRKNLKWLLWSAVSFGIPCFLLLATIIIIKSGIAPNITILLSDIISDVFDAAIKVSINTIAIGFAVNAVIFSVCIVLYTACVFKRKKSTTEVIK